MGTHQPSISPIDTYFFRMKNDHPYASRQQNHFAEHQLHRLWQTVQDLDEAGWEVEVEITDKGIVHIDLEAHSEHTPPFRHFHRLVEACPKVHVLICRFHNGGRIDAGEYVLTFRDGC